MSAKCRSTALATILLATCVLPYSGTAFAQQADLRGTTEMEAQAASPLVKRKLKSLTEPVPGVAPATTGQMPQGNSSENVPGEAEASEKPPLDPALDVSARIADNAESGDNESEDTGVVAPVATNLPALPVGQELPEAIVRAQSDGSIQQEAIGPLGRENERTGSIEGKDRSPEGDPYAAQGIRSGSFVLKPTLESGFHYLTNPDDPTCDCFDSRAESTVTMRAESDWLRHAMNLEMRGTLQKSLSNPSGSEQGGDAEAGFRLAVDGRMDASVDDTVTAAASIERKRETLAAGSSVGYLSRATQTTLDGSLGYAHSAGPFALSARGQVARNMYGDAIDLAGKSLSQDDRDNTYASVTLRGTYDMSAVFSPFAEIEVGRRFYDNELDASGVERSANRYAGRIGMAFNRSDKLTGEFAGGWFTEKSDDPRTKDVSGLDLRGTVNWSPVRDTSVRLTASTEVEGSSSTSRESSVNYNLAAEFTRKLRANLDANLLLSAALRDYTGSLDSQTTLSAQAGATWWMNRYAGLNGKLSYSHTTGTTDGSRDATGVYLGVIVRR